MLYFVFFLNDPATTEIYTLSLHDALPISVRDEHRAEFRATAREQLPPPLAEVAAKSQAPFLQVMVDVEVPRMAFGRVALVGDAAFAVRPHAAAATAKGAEDVWALAAALVRSGEIGRAHV